MKNKKEEKPIEVKSNETEWLDWAEKDELEKQGWIVVEMKNFDRVKKFKLKKGFTKIE